MKKILFSFLCCLSITLTYAQIENQKFLKKDVKEIAPKPDQVPKGGPSNIPNCFCCGTTYNLNAPVINGPDVIDCKGTYKWTWEKCEGAVVGHNFSPFPAGASAGGDNVSVSINLSGAWTGTTTLTVTFICGDKKVTVQKKITAKPCCDCNNLPKSFNISGPQFYCLTDTCKDILSYSAPKFDDTCYKYQWSVSPSIGFSGQGTNQIGLNCKELKVGTYKITLTIICGDKSVTSTIPLTVCLKPNASFGTSFNVPIFIASANFTSTHSYWALYEDVDGNGTWSVGDILVNPPGITSGATFSTNNFAYGKKYLIYHLSINTCGNNKLSCWSLAKSEASATPPSMINNPNNPKPDIKLNVKVGAEAKSIQEIPKQILNSLPKDVLEGLERK